MIFFIMLMIGFMVLGVGLLPAIGYAFLTQLILMLTLEHQ